MDCRLQKLAPYLCGRMKDFGISEYDRPIPEIGHWLRRRARTVTGTHSGTGVAPKFAIFSSSVLSL